MVIEKSAFLSQVDTTLTDIFIERMFTEHAQSRYTPKQYPSNDDYGDNDEANYISFISLCRPRSQGRNEL